MSVQTPVRPDPAGAPNVPQAPQKSNKVKIAAIIVAGIVVLGIVGAVACGGSKTSAPPSVGATHRASSPTPLTAAEAAHKFALDVQSRAPAYSVKYALIDVGEVSTGSQFAPIVALDFGDTPKSFNEWQAMQDVIVGGDAQLLTQAGISSYGLAISGTTFVFAVHVSDVNQVPGPSGHDYTGAVLTKEKLQLALALATVTPSPAASSPAPSTAPAVAAPDGKFSTGECDYDLGNLVGFTFHAKAIASTTITNTGNVGIVADVKAFWNETGHGSLRDQKTVKVPVGRKVRVNFSVPIPSDQLDALQNAAFHSNWCGVHVSIADTYGSVSS
jgi:hypothetical protein